MKKINQFIDPILYAKIAENTRIMSLVNECLPIHLATRVECTGSNGGSLNLTGDSAALSSQLRFYSDSILTALHKGGWSRLRTVKVTTRVTCKTVNGKPKDAVPPLSAHTCRMIQSTAGTIDNARLRQALEKLTRIGGVKTGTGTS